VTTTPLRFLAAINERVLPEDTPPDFAFKYVDISQVDSNGGVAIPADDMRFESAPSRARRLAEPGSTVVSTVRTYLRAIGTVPVDATPLVFSTGFAVLRPLHIDPRFFGYICRSDGFVNEVVARSVGVSYPAISPSDLRDIRLPSPDSHEQRRIADFLDDRVARIDQIITARNSQSALLIPRRRAAVAQAVAGLPKLPIRRLLRRVITGGTPGPEADSPGGLSWFSPGAFRADLTLGQPTRSVEPSACVEFPANTVVMVGIGATAGKVAWLDKRASGNQQLTCLEHHPQVAEARFLLHQLDALGDSLLRSAPAATLPIINNESLRAFNVAIAELQEQHRLSEEWDSRLAQDSEISGRLERSVHLLNEYKQALITAAVTGELDVTTAGSGIPG